MIYTIGHSNHEITSFIGLLRERDITALCDVRSHPYSRYAPQYSREALNAVLVRADISYVFLGKELGARSENPACYRRGKVQYSLLAQEPCFRKGIERVMQGIDRYRVALMCSERDPIECHRALLVARTLFESGVPVSHIHASGEIETHDELETRLLALCKLPEQDMFMTREELIAQAYLIQGDHIAYEDEAMARWGRAIGL